MMTRIVITIAIEEGLLCWLLLTRPKEDAVFIGAGIILVTIVSLGVQLWFVTQRYGITA